MNFYENIIEIVKAVFLGIIEGITEWLPVSSTGHLLITDKFLALNQSPQFKEMFFIVIQLGAVMAVAILFFPKMFPFRIGSGGAGTEFRHPRRIKFVPQTMIIWLKTALACVPGAIVTLLFDDFIEEKLHSAYVIAAALIVYGIAFIIIEKLHKNRRPKDDDIKDISWTDALIIGLFQVLSIIPGTSRSGSTIIGALTIGISRTAAAEFTFFLAVPVMLGYSALKLISFGAALTASETVILLTGTVTAFLVSLAAVKFLMSYIKTHTFTAFGIYRIILGTAILAAAFCSVIA